ncbi:trehalose-phosphatase [Desulfonatronovibrio magnus]|uniref:trehalose-phosphatase n=1 Tax=Desulfonatronovibrio magnus TaxID=698827 RepID=UPI0005EB0EAB|nr:trehalose-phosphatase [Desulfonatronovibrio magnus]
MSKNYVIISRPDYDAVIFDLDGVITRTANVHFRAWKKMFDAYLENSHKNQKTFSDEDYRRYVDGKPRHEGILSFLKSRGINLPMGDEHDDPEVETVHGLGKRKNRYFNHIIRHEGVKVYEPAVKLIKKLRSSGFKTSIVTSSKNCSAVLEAAGIAGLFDHKTDGNDAQELGLKGKPAPDIFLESAEKIGVSPQRAVVLEDAVSGVQAGRNGGFGLVIGVDRTGHSKDLRENGAHVAVTDLSSIKVQSSLSGTKEIPSALERFQEIADSFKNKQVAVFLDYDGTLTPIVDDPDKALLPDDTQSILIELADIVPVAVISGRDRPDVRRLVGLNNIYYAGSHGFDIAGPDQKETHPERVEEFLPELDKAEEKIRSNIADIDGAWVERKKFSIAVHYRKVKETDIKQVKKAVENVSGDHHKLSISGGKKIFEFKPEINWHKGKALLWLLDKLDLDKHQVIALYIGDDVTDEDAFDVLKGKGIGVVVMEKPRDTKADYRLQSPEEVGIFLEKIIQTQKGSQ